MKYEIVDVNDTLIELTIEQIFQLIKKDSCNKYYKIIDGEKIKINNDIVCNTQFICHRINEIDKLQEIDSQFGTEIDIRDDHKTGELILSHDPFSDGNKFEDYIRKYKHGTLILNVKSERVELKCLDVIKKYKITDYFFLDSTFPMIYLLNMQYNNNNIASRFSEYEPLEFTQSIYNFIKWIWIDCFNLLPINKDSYESIKKINKKICIVSPELQQHPEKIELYRKQLNDDGIIPDAICCKKCNIIRWI